MPVLILLPPSEGKTAGEDGARLDLTALSMPALRPARARVLTALVKLCAGAASTSIDGPIGKREQIALATLGLTRGQRGEVRRNAALRSAPTRPAAEIYTGVLYEALDVASLPAPAVAELSRSVLVSSGLWGAARLDDHIPAYRCAIGVCLPVLGGLGTYWRRVLAPVLTAAAGESLVLDLRSGSYAAMWTPTGDVAARTAAVRVLHERDVRGQLTRTVVSHFNKATKGRLLRDLTLAGASPRTPEELVGALRELKYTVEAIRVPGRPWQVDVIVTEV